MDQTSEEYIELKARVKRGVEFLDSRDPDWRDKVTIATLDMSNACRCVLAQVSGVSFWTATDEIEDDLGKVDQIDWADLGLDCNPYSFFEEFPELTRLWKEEITHATNT